MSAPDRVAVVVVHGIADQRAGQTVREIARLLCHGGTGEPRYAQGEIHEVLVPVAKLEPGAAPSLAATRASAGAARQVETSRRRPGAPSGFYQAQKSASGPAAESSAHDLGLALNDYLLGRLELSDRDALYESTRVALRRRSPRRSLRALLGRSVATRRGPAPGGLPCVPPLFATMLTARSRGRARVQRRDSRPGSRRRR